MFSNYFVHRKRILYTFTLHSQLTLISKLGTWNMEQWNFGTLQIDFVHTKKYTVFLVGVGVCICLCVCSEFNIKKYSLFYFICGTRTISISILTTLIPLFPFFKILMLFFHFLFVCFIIQDNNTIKSMVYRQFVYVGCVCFFLNSMSHLVYKCLVFKVALNSKNVFILVILILTSNI